jgi:hypothetical protein
VEGCARCGDFCCELCVQGIARRTVCAACAERPDADFITTTRALVANKRDGLCYLIGCGGALIDLVYLTVGALLLDQQGGLTYVYWFVLSSLTGLFVFLNYLALKPWARRALFGLSGLQLFVAVAVFSRELGGLRSAMFLNAVAQQIIALGLYSVAWFSKRNQAAFGVALDDEAMEALWREALSNRDAWLGFRLALLGLVVPAVELLALLLCVQGLRRTDPDHWPPIGGRRSALIGLSLIPLGAVSSWWLWAAAMPILGVG